MKSKKKGLTRDEILRRIKRWKPPEGPTEEDAKPNKPPFVIRTHYWGRDASHMKVHRKCEEAGGGIAQHSVTAGQEESTMAKWYETESGHVRLGYEIELLKEQFPQMRVGRTQDGQVVVCGNLGPNNLLSKAYYVEAFLPDDFGSGSAISVYVPKEDFPPGTPHLSPGGELSLAHWDWTCKDTVCDALAWATRLACSL